MSSPALRRQAFGLLLIAATIFVYLVIRYWGHLNLSAR